MTMNLKSVITMTLVLAAGFLVLRSVSADSQRSGGLHVTKNCSKDMGLPGQYCTITSSNLGEIPPGTKVYYTQGGPTAAPESGDIAFDSNVVLFVGLGDWAAGRCILDSRQYPGREPDRELSPPGSSHESAFWRSCKPRLLLDPSFRSREYDNPGAFPS